MTRTSAIAALCMILAATSGCGLSDAYRKCGLGGCPQDKETNARVEAALQKHPDIETWNIQVQTLDGVVYLYGLVDNGLERNLVEDFARSTPGVRGVVNSIGVRNFVR